MGVEGVELEKGLRHEKGQTRGRSLFLRDLVKGWGRKKENDSRKLSSSSILERKIEHNRWTWEDRSATEGTYWKKGGIDESTQIKYGLDSKINRF